MSNETLNQVNKQFESFFACPARSYVGLALEHFEKLANAQYEAAQAYTEAGLKQTRAALSINDAKGFQAYVEDQQKVAKEMTERLKGDAEKVVGLNQEFAQQAQKLTASNVNNASKASKASK